VRTTHFWNNIQQVRSEAKRLESHKNWMSLKDIHMIATMDYGHLCPMEENL